MVRAKLVLKASFFMRFKIAFGLTLLTTAFIVSAAIGHKLPYEAGMTGLLGILAYWAQAPELNSREGSDGDSK